MLDRWYGEATRRMLQLARIRPAGRILDTSLNAEQADPGRRRLHMRNRLRRLAALIAFLGVAWATLWPAVSAGHALAMHEAMPLCHMAGMMVDPADGAPQDPRDGAPIPGDGTRTHCPLCIMALYVVFHAAPEPPPIIFSPAFVAFDIHCAAMPFGLEVQLPESRGPPRHFA
jgi:hypothetical protein